MKYYDLKFIQNESLKILDVFDGLCKEHGINYSLSAGTLLGAIRHHGFIPWDDDIDVMMTREQYNKLLKIDNKDYPDGFFLQTYKTDRKYLNGFAKLINKKVPAFIKETEHMDIVHGLDIDIFPMDRCPERYICSIFDLFKLSLCSAAKYSVLDQSCNSILKKISRSFFSAVVRYTGTYRINVFEEKIKTKYNSKKYNASFMSYDSKPPYKWRATDIIPYSIFDEYVYLDFEGKKYEAIKNYELYLTLTYGDYMQLPPEEKRIPMHNFYYYE